MQRTVELTNARFLVEFKKPFNREVFAKFRGDVAKIERRTAVANGAKRSVRAEVKHKYSVVWFGAAVKASAATIESIRALPYVRAVTPDRLMHAMRWST